MKIIRKILRLFVKWHWLHDLREVQGQMKMSRRYYKITGKEIRRMQCAKCGAIKNFLIKDWKTKNYD